MIKFNNLNRLLKDAEKFCAIQYVKHLAFHHRIGGRIGCIQLGPLLCSTEFRDIAMDCLRESQAIMDILNWKSQHHFTGFSPKLILYMSRAMLLISSGSAANAKIETS